MWVTFPIMQLSQYIATSFLYFKPREQSLSTVLNFSALAQEGVRFHQGNHCEIQNKQTITHVLHTHYCKPITYNYCCYLTCFFWKLFIQQDCILLADIEYWRTLKGLCNMMERKIFCVSQKLIPTQEQKDVILATKKD